MSDHHQPDPTPLYVDLDGTLVATDLLWESLAHLLRTRPSHALRVPFWVLRGRSEFKIRLAPYADRDAAHLPYRPEVLDYLKTQHRAGRRLILATAAERGLAQNVCDHLGFFDGLIATEPGVNRKGAAKRAAIQQDCGPAGFDYIGDSRADLPLWQAARRTLIVDPSPRLLRKAQAVCTPFHIFPGRRASLRDWLSTLHPGRWIPNLLVFTPLLAASGPLTGGTLLLATLTFLAFCLITSTVYLLNDLLALPQARTDPATQRQPLASGAITIPGTLAFMAALVLAAGLLALALPWPVGGLLLIHLSAATAALMTFRKPSLALVPGQASLYALRVLAGRAATAIPLPPWLVALSIGLCVALAIARQTGRTSDS